MPAPQRMDKLLSCHLDDRVAQVLCSACVKVVSLTAAGSACLRNRQWQSSLQLLAECLELVKCKSVRLPEMRCSLRSVELILQRKGCALRHFAQIAMPRMSR